MKNTKSIDRDFDKLYRQYEARMFRRALKTLVVVIVLAGIVGAIR